MERKIIALVDDMLFISKIRATAESVGVTVKFARSIDAACEAATQNAASLIIADLQVHSCDPFALAERLKSSDLLKRVPLVGFFSHVETTLLHRAEASGYDRVMPRSLFSKNLAEILLESNVETPKET